MLFATFTRGLATLMGLSVLAATASAQVITVAQDVLTAGKPATVDYSNPSLAGQQVTIEISGGFPVPSVETITITLDKNGNGSGTWTVSTAWRSARFNAPGATEVCVPIDQ